MKKFDNEYRTQFVDEMKWLKENNVDYTFVKYIDGITTYKYKKTLKLFELLATFYKDK